MLLKLITCFFMYSFLGWVLESIYCTIIDSIHEKKLTIVNRGFCTGPVCPIYGSTAVIMILTLSSFKDNIFLLALVGVLVCDAIEYTTSYVMEKSFHARWWDYSTYFLNLNGRICFKHSIYWVFLSVVFIKYINPFFDNLLSNIPLNIINSVIIVSVMIFILDFVNTVIASIDIRSVQRKLFNIKQSFASLDTEQAREIINGSLKEFQQNLLKITPYRRSKAMRILREYPRISEYLMNQISELQSVPSEFKDELEQIRYDLKSHFSIHDKDIFS